MTTPTFVFVPGAGGAASYWDLVRARLSDRGVPSVAVALPGADRSQGLPEYVDLVCKAAAPFDEVVLVGQSLGGFSASWAAASIEPRELILVNAMIPRPGETAGQWWASTGSGAAMADNDRRAGRDPDGGFDPDVYFFHDVPVDVLAAATEEPEDETDTVFDAPWGPQAWPDVPTRVIASEDDRLFPLEFQRRIARERLGLDVEVVPGGHLSALSRPDELTAALVRTL